MTTLTIKKIGPGASIQDLGRRGLLAQGLSRGGAADRLALLEGAALLDQSPDCAALEMTAMGGTFNVDAPSRIALTGAPLRAQIDGESVTWHASHRLKPGQTLTLGPGKGGVWSYLHLGGGIQTDPIMGSRATHLSLKLGLIPETGTELPLKDDQSGPVERVVDVADRFKGGQVRVLASTHTALFSQDDIDRFETTTFTRDQRGNRQGVRLNHDGAPFAIADQLGIVSEVIVPGDIQMTGEGTPYILLPECQTTGGYPRIGSVLPDDLPKAAQAAAGAELTFRFIDRDQATDLHKSEDDLLKALKKSVRPLVRDPREMRDLGSYQLISGVTAGTNEKGELA
ncbi:biotin-dependent carboxyltransferase family protein [Maribius pontilimi]|uniref:Biotin-dependent carboxyltransferase family protein n=1 Tax=Palleronia pontilimi TaxID=1964209 RepID=A0A934II40_9RHOB|nr:biotin-dependent carboxyltransferase family protein [Palleronia pontilimi]MBJ3762314.1 biotin-dependent carboxyltransferase family protein [Palleronia pontilimi]